MQCGTVQAAGNEERLREEVAEIPLLTDKLPAIQNIFLSTGHPLNGIKPVSPFCEATLSSIESRFPNLSYRFSLALSLLQKSPART
jgi:hypothetical protein